MRNKEKSEVAVTPAMYMDHSTKLATILAEMGIAPAPSGQKTSLQNVVEDFVLAASTVGRFSGSIVRDFDDKKLSGAEAFDLVAQAPAVFTSVKAALARVRDYSRLEDIDREKVVSAFAQSFDITNDAAELAIESLLSNAEKIAVSLSKILKALADFRVAMLSAVNPAPAPEAPQG